MRWTSTAADTRFSLSNSISIGSVTVSQELSLMEVGSMVSAEKVQGWGVVHERSCKLMNDLSRGEREGQHEDDRGMRRRMGS